MALGSLDNSAVIADHALSVARSAPRNSGPMGGAFESGPMAPPGGASGMGGGGGANHYTVRPQAQQNALNSYLQLYGGANAPQQQDLSFQGQLLQNQMGMNQANQQTQAGFLRQDHNLAMRGLGLDQRGLGVDRRGIQRNLAFSRQEEEIARQMLANSQAQTNQGARESTQAARSEAIAGGAMAAPGITTDLTNIYGNLVMDREANQLGFDRDLLGIRQQRGNLRDQNRQLNIQADRYGLSQDQLRNSLTQGLTNLRLDGMMSMQDLLSAMSSNNAQQAALAQQIFQQALQAAQYGG